MDKRFFCPTLPEMGEILLDGPEAHHLTKVMRLPVGERVELFDGAGAIATTEIVAISKRDVRLKLQDRRVFPAVTSSLTLAVAVPKGERFDWLIEKATELGVTKLIPIRTARGVVDPRDTKLERLRQVIIEACKQSRRPWLMELTPMQDFSSVLAVNNGMLIADPSGSPLQKVWPAGSTPGETVVAIGPEGGWTDEELAAAEASGAKRLALGDTILRIETAAMAIAAWWRLNSSTL
jgi:16S rRNA (uracil1498-N3)-methyltransferase